jgi:hypothetical protein
MSNGKSILNNVLLRFATFGDDPYDTPNEDLRTKQIIEATIKEFIDIVDSVKENQFDYDNVESALDEIKSKITGEVL